MNENEIDRIAAMGNVLRPDWPLASLRTLLTKHELKVRPRRDVAVALAWIACESATKTPARILEAGPWWIAANAEGNKVRTSYTLPCPDHDGETLPCGRCANEAADYETRSTAAQLARAQLASVRSRLCSHGVPFTHCREPHDIAKAREHDQHETQHPDATEEQEMPDRCQCGHTWEYHGPEVPGCCECTCRDLPSSKESA